VCVCVCNTSSRAMSRHFKAKLSTENYTVSRIYILEVKQ